MSLYPCVNIALFPYIHKQYAHAALNVLLSGAGDEFGISNAAYDILIPGFVSALTSLQEPFPYPPKPQIYEGTYSSGIPGQPNVTITTVNKQLLVKTPLGSYYLAYHGIELALQVSHHIVCWKFSCALISYYNHADPPLFPKW